MKQVIIRPIISEKTLSLAGVENKYTFVVDLNANKIEIAQAVNEAFDVEVDSVDTMVTLGKRVTFGKKRIQGRRNPYKKAVVTLKKGDTISEFNIEQ